MGIRLSKLGNRVRQSGNSVSVHISTHDKIEGLRQSPTLCKKVTGHVSNFRSKPNCIVLTVIKHFFFINHADMAYCLPSEANNVYIGVLSFIQSLASATGILICITILKCRLHSDSMSFRLVHFLLVVF